LSHASFDPVIFVLCIVKVDVVVTFPAQGDEVVLFVSATPGAGCDVVQVESSFASVDVAAGAMPVGLLEQVTPEFGPQPIPLDP
tara:strand:- start:297 stop:548 length:252 start_codon:yes stop_codon:yes gene_type:complete